MKLTGSKLFSSAVFTLTSAAVFAAPDLVEFSAGTPAKAEEVNSNFSSLKTFSTEIESRVSLIENSGRADTINSLQGRVTALETVDHVAPVKAIADRVTSLENVDHSAPITSLQGRVAPLESSVETLEARVTALENSGVSADILDLQNRVSNLESASPTSDEFTIKVYGDGVLLGYTNRVLHNVDKPFIQIKTPLGMAAIAGEYEDTGYYLDGYDELNDSAGLSGSVYYSENTCSENPTRVIGGSQIPQLVFTKVANIIDKNTFIHNGKATYFIEAGTAFTKTSSETTLYSYNKWDNSCRENVIASNSLITPIIEVSLQSHGLKSTYSTITIEGYASPL